VLLPFAFLRVPFDWAENYMAGLHFTSVLMWSFQATISVEILLALHIEKVALLLD
jgi:hypothetical protein